MGLTDGRFATVLTLPSLAVVGTDAGHISRVMSLALFWAPISRLAQFPHGLRAEYDGVLADRAYEGHYRLSP